MQDSANGPAPEIHHHRLGRSLAARNQCQIAVRRHGAAAGNGPHSRAETPLREVDREVSIATADDIEAPLSEDDQPVRGEVEAVVRLVRAAAELASAFDFDETQNHSPERHIGDLATVWGDRAALVV